MPCLASHPPKFQFVFDIMAHKAFLTFFVLFLSFSYVLSISAVPTTSKALFIYLFIFYIKFLGLVVNLNCHKSFSFIQIICNIELRVIFNFQFPG